MLCPSTAALTAAQYVVFGLDGAVSLMTNGFHSLPKPWTSGFETRLRDLLSLPNGTANHLGGSHYL